jgi:hypothetical protein
VGVFGGGHARHVSRGYITRQSGEQRKSLLGAEAPAGQSLSREWAIEELIRAALTEMALDVVAAGEGCVEAVSLLGHRIPAAAMSRFTSSTQFSTTTGSTATAASGSTAMVIDSLCTSKPR